MVPTETHRRPEKTIQFSRKQKKCKHQKQSIANHRKQKKPTETHRQQMKDNRKLQIHRNPLKSIEIQRHL